MTTWLPWLLLSLVCLALCLLVPQATLWAWLGMLFAYYMRLAIPPGGNDE